mmetsp:Transcript_26495/g.43457  ORF Transcript_26495/g.43457 Transcript_26495/m.43457 type:complete len:113 (+) Transcript_26495:865-1203(+)
MHCPDQWHVSCTEPVSFAETRKWLPRTHQRGQPHASSTHNSKARVQRAEGLEQNELSKLEHTRGHWQDFLSNLECGSQGEAVRPATPSEVETNIISGADSSPTTFDYPNEWG